MAIQFTRTFQSTKLLTFSMFSELIFDQGNKVNQFAQVWTRATCGTICVLLKRTSLLRKLFTGSGKGQHAKTIHIAFRTVTNGWNDLLLYTYFRSIAGVAHRYWSVTASRSRSPAEGG